METPQKNISKYQKETYISRFTVDGNQTKWTFPPPLLSHSYISRIIISL
jgi:hypothetical protein